MELFRKIGPRVILIEHRGRLLGLVTVKDCLKYQFKAEAAESGHVNGSSRVDDRQERIWFLLKGAAWWVGDKVSLVSGGRIRLSGSFDEPQSARGRGGGRIGDDHSHDHEGSGNIMDGTEDIGHEEGVELTSR